MLAAAQPGQRVRLHTHHLVREDLQALYGFRTAEELGFFGLLLTVTGVGPKVALAILGSRPVAELQLAILAGDEAVLTSISGVGKRLAGRIVLELREKVAAAGSAVAGTAPRGSAAGPTEGEVVAALQALGYTLGEAREAARNGGRGRPGRHARGPGEGRPPGDLRPGDLTAAPVRSGTGCDLGRRPVPARSAARAMPPPVSNIRAKGRRFVLDSRR